MKKIIFILCVWVAAARNLSADSAPALPLMPSAQLRSVDGSIFSLLPTKISKPTLIIFWATWCRPCINKIPALKRLFQEYRDKIDIIAISEDTSLEQLKKSISVYELKYVNLIDDKGKAGDLFGVKQTPTLFAIDAQGRIVARGSRAESMKTILLGLTKATTSTPSTVRDAVLMGTEISLVVLSVDEKMANEAIDEALKEIERIELIDGAFDISYASAGTLLTHGLDIQQKNAKM